MFFIRRYGFNIFFCKREILLQCVPLPTLRKTLIYFQDQGAEVCGFTKLILAQKLQVVWVTQNVIGCKKLNHMISKAKVM